MALGLYGSPLAAQELSVLATPRNDARSEADPVRAYLGVTFEPEQPDAAVARSVALGSPAEQAGLRAGDVIETLNGQRVTTYQDVLDAIRWMKPGDSIDIVASRRVSIRTQAVLEQAPVGYRRTVDQASSPVDTENESVYPAIAEELLPAPAAFRARTPQREPQFNANLITPRRYPATQNARRSERDRPDLRDNRERDSRNRGLFLRRRNVR
jgi:membrane-associated protease RseP (regulator of RpoE activity)